MVKVLKKEPFPKNREIKIQANDIFNIFQLIFQTHVSVPRPHQQGN